MIYINKYGNKWVEIAKKMPGRTENWVKNLFFFATLRRYVRNINKFKSVQTEIKILDNQNINEKWLSELFLIDDINFEDFQCIDSDEFKLLTKKVAKSRRRKDSNLVEYLIGSCSNQTKHKIKSAKWKELTPETIDILDKIKKVLDLLSSSEKF